MIRLLGVDLPRNKKMYVALTAIYGIGYKTAFKILEKTSISPDQKLESLTDENIKNLRFLLESGEYKLEGDLRRLVNLNVKRLVDIGSYRGRRHIKGLPVRGQRTRTNSRTSRLVRIYSAKKRK